VFGHRAAHGSAAGTLLQFLRGGRRAQPRRVLLATAVLAGRGHHDGELQPPHHALRGH
nr:hypothetical protein [Tanacetum cinerariifolium]